MPNDTTTAMSDVLARICGDTRADTAARKTSRPIEALRHEIATRNDPPRGFGQALKEATDLLAAAQELKDELQKAGDYVVPLSSVKRTEEIERLAKRIRGRLKQ